MVISAAVATSPSANTSAGLLPPSSRLTRLKVLADASMIFRPTARLPVNEILSTIGWLISASPVGSPGPVTTLSTPAGQTGLLDQPDEPQHRERRVLRRLEHDGAAGRQRRGELLRGEQQRRVPRHDRADDADRLAQRHDQVVAALVGGSVSPPSLSTQPA